MPTVIESTCTKGQLNDIISVFTYTSLMRKIIDNVEIKEPPMEELGKKHSCLRRTCATSFGCFIVLILVSVLILKFAIGPKVRELKDIPSQFAEHVPLYDSENINTIKITKGQERNRGAEYIAFLPKLVISPVVLVLDNGDSFIQNNNPSTSTIKEDLTAKEKFVAFMKTPVADHSDEYVIEWKNLDAEPSYIEEYYRNELAEAGFQSNLSSRTQTMRNFTFSKYGIDGVLYIKDHNETEETDMVELTVKIDTNKVRRILKQ